MVHLLFKKKNKYFEKSQDTDTYNSWNIIVWIFEVIIKEVSGLQKKSWEDDRKYASANSLFKESKLKLLIIISESKSKIGFVSHESDSKV